MTDLTSFFKTDLLDDHVADDINRLIAASLRAEFRNVETITATKELADSDCQFQNITASGANRTVELAPEATTNHFFVISNVGGSNNVIVKDDSGVTTFTTLFPDEWCLAISNGSAWKTLFPGRSARVWAGKTAAPTTGDDSADGIAVGDRWIDETNDKEYVALDVTVGAAVWTETTGAGGGASDGWIAGSGTWTYASADSPTFTLTVNADLTSAIGVGNRIKLTQTTAKYFIVTAISYSSPNTTITIYGGVDYTLANAAISNPYYSSAKAPVGFPLDPEKWQVTFTDTSSRSQASPAQNTWYNLGSLSVSIPIGVWRIKITVVLQTSDNTAATGVTNVTFSTANNSESSNKLTRAHYFQVTGGTAVQFISHEIIDGIINIATKTTYYFNAQTGSTGVDTIFFRNDIVPLYFVAECAYL